MNFGKWEPKDGVLVCQRIKADDHAAASRWQIPLQDGVIEFSLKFSGGKVFHVGFDPKRGTLDKKGHLYSLIISPTGAQLKKHRDKAKEGSEDEVLARAKHKLEPEKWVSVRLEAKGNTVNCLLYTSDAADEE